MIMRTLALLAILMLASCTTSPPADESSIKATAAIHAVAEDLLNSFNEREKVYGLIILGREAEVRTALSKQPHLINEPSTADRPEILIEAAVRYGSLSLIRFFISQKADLSVRCSQGATIAELASALREKDRYETVKLLLSAGASPNPFPRQQTAETYSSSALHHAVSAGDHALVRLLLAKGADPNVRDRDGDTPLHHLYSWRHEELPFDLIKLLLKHGADPNLSNQDGENVLFHAPLKNRSPHWPAAIRAAVQNGADVNHRSADGDTPLHHASRLWVNLPHFETLLALGADPTIKNHDGGSPLSEAVWELNWLKERKTASAERIREREKVLELLKQQATKLGHSNQPF
ncbi:MAG: ankyrin repeat domain-containing protein [Verrucomicrobiota bacterium]